MHSIENKAAVLAKAKRRGEGLLAIRRLIESINDAHAELSDQRPDTDWDAKDLFEGFCAPLSFLVAKEIGMVDNIGDVEVNLDGPGSETRTLIELDYPHDYDFMEDDRFIAPEYKRVYERIKPVYLDEVGLIDDETDRADCLEEMMTVWLGRQTAYFKDITINGKTGDLIFKIQRDYPEEEDNPIEMYNLSGYFFLDDRAVAGIYGDLHFFFDHQDEEATLKDYIIHMDEYSDHDADFAAFISKSIRSGDLGILSLHDLYYREGQGNLCVVKWRGTDIRKDMVDLFAQADVMDAATDVFEENFSLLSDHLVEKLAYQGLDITSPDFDDQLVDVFPEEKDPFSEATDIGMVACVSELHSIGHYIKYGPRSPEDESVEDFVLKSARYHVMLNEFINRKHERVSQGALKTQRLWYTMVVLDPNQDANPDLRLGQVIKGHYL